MRQIHEYYADYSEENRLFDCNQHLSEYLVTMHLLRKHVPIKGKAILDCCAGAGAYAFALAREGARVTAGDLVEENTEKIRCHPDASLLENTYSGSATELSFFPASVFDCVLCMGALYHLDAAERDRCIRECLRVLKKGGVLVLAWHSVYALTMGAYLHAIRQTEPALRRAAFETLDQCCQTRRRNIFYGITVDEICSLPERYAMECITNASTYPALYNQFPQIDSFTEEEFSQYVNCLCETCEDELAVRYTMHGLSFFRKL